MRRSILAFLILSLSAVQACDDAQLDLENKDRGPVGRVETQTQMLVEKPLHETYSAPLDETSEQKSVEVISAFPAEPNRRAVAASIAIEQAQQEIVRMKSQWDLESIGADERRNRIARIKELMMSEDNLASIEREQEEGR